MNNMSMPPPHKGRKTGAYLKQLTLKRKDIKRTIVKGGMLMAYRSLLYKGVIYVKKE